jgi:hypothetical protein
MKSCVDCKFYSPAPAGVYFDRCKHPLANVPTMTATANRAGKDKCVHLRRFLGACGIKASLFEAGNGRSFWITAAPNEGE